MAKPMRLKRLIQLFLKWCEKVRSPKTAENYRFLLAKFLRHIGNKPIASIKPMQLSMWAKTWHDVQIVQRLFNWAVNDLQAIRKNQFARVERPMRKQRTRIFTRQEEIAYLRRATLEHRRFLIAMRGTAARPGEISSLTWSMLRAPIEWPGTIEECLEAGKAMFVITRGFKSQERMADPHKPRLILMTRRVQRLVLRLLRRAGSREGLVFPNRKNERLTVNAIRCRFRRVRAKFPDTMYVNGEPLVTYSFRHTAATMASLKVSQKVLAELLGHRSVETTQRYLHLQVGHLQEGMEKIQDMTPVRIQREERKKKIAAGKKCDDTDDAKKAA